MESIILGINVIFPLLCYMLIGIILKKSKWLSEKTLEEMNRVVFRVFMFTLVFLNTYNIDLTSIGSKENICMLILALAALALVFMIASIYCRTKKIPIKRSAVIVQGLYRSNLALFGLPVSIAIYGEGDLGAVSILLALIVPIYNIVAVILLGNASGGENIGVNTFISIFKNPLVTGTVFGLIINILPLTLDGVVLNTVESLAKVATPLAFIVLGGSLVISDLRKDIKDVLWVCIIRLVVIPIIVISIAIALGLRDRHIIALLGAFASPAAVASFTMAKDMDVESNLAGEIVAVSTMMSLLTIFGWIVSLKTFGII